MTFVEFLADAAARGEAVNTVFEERLFELVGVLHRISATFAARDIAHEVVGGLAVLIHVEAADPEHSVLTRDVDLMVDRAELELIKDAASADGFRFRHVAGVDMLLYSETDRARNAVHLVFSGERVRPSQVLPNPLIKPERKRVQGKDVMVTPVAGLVRMKLRAFRNKDRVHVRSMDARGLITADVENGLDAELASRLKHVRETE